MKICPSIVSNKAQLNMYSAISFSSMMYVAATHSIPCREIRCYDLHPISAARNVAVDEFMKDKDATHLLFVDDDVVVPVDTLPRLLQHDKLVVGGWYILRGNKLPSVFMQGKLGGYVQVSQQELVNARRKQPLLPVDGNGVGCILIQREVFNILDKPYFLEMEGSQGCGEDLFFHSKCRKFGIPTYVDVNLFCRHHHFILL